jgi:hypothetical protein
MTLSKIATLSIFLASASLVAGHGFVSSILANGQKYVYINHIKGFPQILTFDPATPVILSTPTRT